MKQGISESALRMRNMIEIAIDKHKITRDDYDAIIAIALEDGTIDSQERTMLSQLQDLIDDKTIKIIKQKPKKMDSKRFEEIFEETDSDLSNIDGDNAYLGLQIIAKYTKRLICGAEHDMIFSESIDNLIENGITEEDVIQLSKLNWMIEYDSLACFV